MIKQTFRVLLEHVLIARGYFGYVVTKNDYQFRLEVIPYRQLPMSDYFSIFLLN